jgi:hypothetical protein
MSVEGLFAEIAGELRRAEAKFPSWPDDIVHGAAVMAEESGEAVKAALDCYYRFAPVSDYREELIQTAAMCVRALLDLDQRKLRRNTWERLAGEQRETSRAALAGGEEE